MFFMGSCPAEAGRLPILSRMPAGQARPPMAQPAGRKVLVGARTEGPRRRRRSRVLDGILPGGSVEDRSSRTSLPDPAAGPAVGPVVGGAIWAGVTFQGFSELLAPAGTHAFVKE